MLQGGCAYDRQGVGCANNAVPLFSLVDHFKQRADSAEQLVV